MKGANEGGDDSGQVDAEDHDGGNLRAVLAHHMQVLLLGILVRVLKLVDHLLKTLRVVVRESLKVEAGSIPEEVRAM